MPQAAWSRPNGYSEERYLDRLIGIYRKLLAARNDGKTAPGQNRQTELYSLARLVRGIC